MVLSASSPCKFPAGLRRLPPSGWDTMSPSLKVSEMHATHSPAFPTTQSPPPLLSTSKLTCLTAGPFTSLGRSQFNPPDTKPRDLQFLRSTSRLIPKL